MNRLRVLHIVNSLELGGAESMLTALVTRGTRPDVEPIVVSLISAGAHAKTIEAAGIRLHQLGLELSPAGLFSLPAKIIRLCRIVREVRPHIVQSWLYYADLFALAALWLSGRRSVTKLIWGIRCSDMDLSRYSRTLRLAVNLCARLSNRPDMIISNSNAGLAVHRAYGYHPRRFAVIPNGIDTARFRPDMETRMTVRRRLGIGLDQLVAAIVARVDPMKDHGTFLAALDRVDKIHAIAVGTGTEDLPDHPRLHRLGPRTDVPEILAACDFIVSSSSFGEGFSNAIAEGMSAGLVPIATDVGDADTIIGDCGVIVPPRNQAALAAAMGSLANEGADIRAERGRLARERVSSEFSLVRAAVRFAEIYRELGPKRPAALASHK